MAENSQAVIPDNLIIVDGEIGLPSSSASDAGKVLAVDSNGDPSWVTPSGGTLYTEGNGIDISDQNVVSIDTTVVATKTDLSGLQGELTAGTGIDITNDTISVDTSVIATQNDISGLQPTLTAGDNISISNNTISATDTTYTAGTGLSLTGTEFAVDTTVIATQNDLPSSDELLPSATSSDEGKVLTIDSQGEAGWATPASVDEVPAVTSNDDGKVLKATYSGGVGSYAWATESGGGSSYTAGTGIDITNDTISVDNTVALKTDIPAKGSLMVKSGTTQKELYDAWAAGWTIQSNHGNETNVYELTEFDYDSGEYTATFSLITFGETTVSETSFVINGIASSTSAVSFGATTRKRTNKVPDASSQTVGKVLTIKSVPDEDPIASWESLPTVDEVPAVTSTDDGKVLTASYSGGTGSFAWATPSGGTTYTAGNMISLANDAVAVSTTAGITDIQQVASLPANPVATVLYLIPEA